MLTSLADLISSTLYSLNPNNDLSYYQKEALFIVAIEQALAKVWDISIITLVGIPSRFYIFSILCNWKFGTGIFFLYKMT